MAKRDEEGGKVCVLMQAPILPLPGILQQLEGRYKVMQVGELDANPEAASTVSALISCRQVRRPFLDLLPNLRIIANTGSGVDNIDLDYCRQHGIHVTNAAHVSLLEDTADFAILLMLGAIRRICPAQRFLQEGLWSLTPFPLTKKASGLQVGIVGLGGVGKAIAKRLEGLDSIVSYCGTAKKPDVPYAYYSKLLDLAANSDALIVACSLSESTTHLIGREVLDALGPEGTLINVARGAVVDELELCKALAEKRLGAAGLDVFEKEPTVSAELLRMDNVVLSPHAATATWETRVAVGQLIVDNLDAFFSGKPLLTPIL